MRRVSVVSTGEENGLEPIEFVHQMALAEVHPGLQKQFPLVNIDSAWVLRRGDRDVQVLSYWLSDHRLRLYWGDGDFGWSRGCRFLALVPQGWQPPEGVKVIRQSA